MIKSIGAITYDNYPYLEENILIVSDIIINNLTDFNEYKYKIFLNLEPIDIISNDIKKYIINNFNDYDLILSWDIDLLKLPNCKLFTFGTTWLKNDNNKWISTNYEINSPNKENKISFLRGDKNYTIGHKLRHNIFNSINDDKLIKYDRIPYNDWQSRDELLFKIFEFNITVENSQHENYFSEKIIDCFISKTIPIYYGCLNISNYFDNRGFFTFNNIEELNNIINGITPNTYKNMELFVNKNYKLAMEHEKGGFYNRIFNEIKQINQ